MSEELSISQQVSQKFDELRAEAEANFARGYQKGREDQRSEDEYYIGRVSELTRLLAEAESEIKRLRA
jgi:ADP-dependent phosphofructokinase/glucokinase